LAASEGKAMAVIDPDFEWRRQTWFRFTRLIKYSLASVIVLLILLAIFLL
jgi:hypothetical protein